MPSYPHASNLRRTDWQGVFAQAVLRLTDKMHSKKLKHSSIYLASIQDVYIAALPDMQKPACLLQQIQDSQAVSSAGLQKPNSALYAPVIG